MVHGATQVTANLLVTHCVVDEAKAVILVITPVSGWKKT